MNERKCKRISPTGRDEIAPARSRVAEAGNDDLALLLPQRPDRLPDRVARNDVAAARVDAEDDSAYRVVLARFF